MRIIAKLLLLSLEEDEEVVLNAVMSALGSFENKTQLKEEIACEKLAFAGMEIDASKRLVYRGEKEVNITFTEFEILHLLARNPGRVFSKEQIYDIVWKESYSGDYNIIMSHIRNIREKIENNPSKPTGTPISNSMTELYTNMRYLQYGTLQKLGLGHFDAWAASFGETQTAIELAPEGTGYRAKTRFAKFFNLPELIALFKESADIQTPDMLKLPVPEAEYENVVLKPSEFQKDMVASLAERAEAVRDRQVQPYEDNMLKITNDGRKLALDQRLLNDMLPDEENSKAATCVEKAYEIWQDTKEQKSAQLIFCDLSTPKGDGTFNVYEDIKNKLMEKGVPENEIAFIHDANTELRKAELFAKVRSGQVRFLLGSTAKMGAGTNVQDRLIALHHLDVPWRPSDVGRILRTFKIKKNVEVTDNGKIII